MKLVYTRMTPLVNGSLHVEKRTQPFLYSPYHGKPTFHAHPEYQLTFIVKGYGKRIIGNNIAPYSQGDMVFVGANLPHIWLSDPDFYEGDAGLQASAIVAYINPTVFEQMFDLLDEFAAIKRMLSLSSRGLSIHGDTKRRLAAQLEQLFELSGYARVKGFLNILHTIAVSAEKKTINDSRISVAGRMRLDRLAPVLDYIKENLDQPIPLEVLADLVYMTAPSFSRFFRERMGINLSQYITAERMELARKLLIKLDKPVYEIAARCGYNSDSHFCKIFKEHTGISPYQYKAKANAIRVLAEG